MKGYPPTYFVSILSFVHFLVDDKDDQKTGKRKSNVENEMRKQQPFIGANGGRGTSFYT